MYQDKQKNNTNNSVKKVDINNDSPKVLLSAVESASRVKAFTDGGYTIVIREVNRETLYDVARAKNATPEVLKAVVSEVFAYNDKKQAAVGGNSFHEDIPSKNGKNILYEEILGAVIENKNCSEKIASKIATLYGLKSYRKNAPSETIALVEKFNKKFPKIIANYRLKMVKESLNRKNGSKTNDERKNNKSFDEYFADYKAYDNGGNLDKEILANAKKVYETLKTPGLIMTFATADQNIKEEMIVDFPYDDNSYGSFCCVCEAAQQYAEYVSKDKPYTFDEYFSGYKSINKGTENTKEVLTNAKTLLKTLKTPEAISSFRKNPQNESSIPNFRDTCFCAYTYAKYAKEYIKDNSKNQTKDNLVGKMIHSVKEY